MDSKNVILHYSKLILYDLVVNMMGLYNVKDRVNSEGFLSLGAFVNLRKVTISFVMSVPVRPSAWKNSALTGGDIYDISYLSVFRTSGEKNQVSLKSDKNNGYFT